MQFLSNRKEWDCWSQLLVTTHQDSFTCPQKCQHQKGIKQRNPTSLSLYRLRTRVFLQSYWMQVCKSNLTIFTVSNFINEGATPQKDLLLQAQQAAALPQQNSKARQGSNSWDFSLQSGPTFLHVSGFAISSSASLTHTSYSTFITLALLHVACTAHWQVVHVVPWYLIFIEHTHSSVCGQLTQFVTNKSFTNQFKTPHQAFGMGCKKPASKLWPQAAVVFTGETHSAAFQLLALLSSLTSIAQERAYPVRGMPVVCIYLRNDSKTRSAAICSRT